MNSSVHMVRAFGRKKNFELISDPNMTEVFQLIATPYDPLVPVDYSFVLTYQDSSWSVDTVGEPMEMRLDNDLVNIKMDVSDAWKLAKEKLNVISFHNWTLMQNIYPMNKPPFFAFQNDSGFVIVDIQTSEVTFETYGYPNTLFNY